MLLTLNVFVATICSFFLSQYAINNDNYVNINNCFDFKSDKNRERYIFIKLNKTTKCDVFFSIYVYIQMKLFIYNFNSNNKLFWFLLFGLFSGMFF